MHPSSFPSLQWDLACPWLRPASRLACPWGCLHIPRAGEFGGDLGASPFLSPGQLEGIG